MGPASEAHHNIHGLWTPYKALASVVEEAILRRSPGLRHDLERSLRQHKPHFTALLKNPSRNPADAELVRKAQSEGIAWPPGSNSGRIESIPSQIVEEALILAEMFDLNEISALQLLLLGEEQLNQYPGLTRGLVAVLLYFDGRKALVQSLRTLVQGRSGVTWTLELTNDISELVMEYTDELLEGGIVEKILSLLHSLNWSKENVRLQKNMALGNAKHRRQVQDLFLDINQSLADCIFCFAAQGGLSQNDTTRLIDYLCKVKIGDAEVSGVIDNTHLTLLMALLYALDVSVLNKTDDGETAIKGLPILKDKSFIPIVHRELGPNSNRKWAHPAIQSLAQFAWSMTVSTLRSVPNLSTAIIDDDEAIMDAALENRLFHLLPEVILPNPLMLKEEFYHRRMHQLITDFIVLMPLKVKELRNRADDAARNCLMHEQEGIHYNIPKAGQHFENILQTIAKMYEKDPMNLGLALDYWCPTDGGNNSGMTERYPQRQVSLYKFVRLAGDLLMPTLYTPYVKMLVGLSNHPQSALHCFNLLKLNGMTGGQQGANTVSWDHFFSSMQQYFSNLRQEQMPFFSGAASDVVYRLSRPMTRGISPAEINGLITVLKLVGTVSRQCEAVRIAMAENSAWQPLLVLIGLLGCAVPSPLKAEIILTLAAFAKSSSISRVVWENIESSQIINTIPNVANNRQCLGTELEEVESRNEEYPMTQAFLHLLDVLAHNAMPENLGAGTRIPGLEPYFRFVRDAIFLKFNTRAYKIPEEKWKVASGCLKFFKVLLEHYDPSVTDFNFKMTTSQNQESVTRHAGFELMVQFLQNSQTLRTLLYILDEGCAHFDMFMPFNGKVELEQACLTCLEILEIAMDKQFSFLECARDANTSILLSPLDHLLLGVNPRSGKPDHMLNVAKFVTYSWWLPAQTYFAIKVLTHVSSSVTAQESLLSTLNHNEEIAKNVIKGFTDVLDNEDFNAVESHDEETLQENGRYIAASRIAIVELLLNGLSLPVRASLSHFLLGFELKKSIAKSTLQPPGIMGAIRTPFHALLALLRPTSNKSFSPNLVTCPHLCEKAFHLIYMLSSDNQTYEPTLRYLRSSEDFLSCQLAVLPLPEEVESVQIIKGMAWLLKTLAIELKLVCSSRLRSQVTLLINLLLDASSPNARATGDDSHLGDPESTFSQLSRTTVSTMASTRPQASSRQHRLLQVLNGINFVEVPMSTPNWEIFDTSQVRDVIKMCEKTSFTGERSIDVPKMHRILTEELANLQGATALSQRQIIQEEIKSILLYVVDMNSAQERESSKKNILDAWRQVTEVMLCSVPGDILSSSAKQQLLLDVLQTLLNKVLVDDTLPELANQVSGVVLLLLASLRQTYSSSNSDPSESRDRAGARGDNFVSILDATQLNRTVSHQTASKSSMVYSTALYVILKGLILWINSTSASAQKVRSNLYGALLNYLRIGKADVSSNESSESMAYQKFRKANLEIILDFGENFLDILCRDTVSGHNIRRMLAVSVLDELIKLDGRGTWTFYMSNQGYLRHIIESLSKEDDELLSLLNPSPGDLRLLYTYESKMAMLIRLASTVTGAELLLESGLMLRLAEMNVFSARPDVSPAVMEIDDNAFFPSPFSRYHQILFPVLTLCEALLASLGSDNRSVTAQILHFITANDDLVRTILKSRGLWTIAHLRELSLLTGLISQCVAQSEFMGEDTGDLGLPAFITLIQRLMLGLMPHFDLTERLTSILQKNFNGKQLDEATKLVLEISSHIFGFAKNLVSKSLSQSKYCRILFTPSLLEANDARQFEEQTQLNIPTRPPSLGQVILAVKHLSTHLHDASSVVEDLRVKSNTISHLSNEELDVFVSSDLATTNKVMSTNERRLLVSSIINSSIAEKEHQIKLAQGSIEKATLLIWAHLEHFIFYANADSDSSLTPYQKAYRVQIDDFHPPGDLSNELSTHSSMSRASLQKLKDEIRTCFNESLFYQIEDVNSIIGKSSPDVASFLEIMIRRLKRLASLHT